ncbi:MAG: hypothetical protein ACR2P3_04520, partial [Geminicoccaceae bacterium]
AAVERLGERLTAGERDIALQALERAAVWLGRNGEHHGILSNHLAAAAGALQLAGDLHGTDRFQSACQRYLDIIYREQHPSEGWLNEYGGPDPGYQSHGMFYLAEIERRTGDEALLACLKKASDFIVWFAHPDGTLGGEYASRGTKFCYPAAFEMLASRIPSAAAVAAHARSSLAAGRGIGAQEMDAWNQFPLLNNLLFACDAEQTLDTPPDLPSKADGAGKVFPEGGLAIANRRGRVLVVGGRTGGITKIWNPAGNLVYEDCGYGIEQKGRWAVSQGRSEWAWQVVDTGLQVEITAPFRGLPALRFSPWRFIGFRLFTTTMGRAPAIARRLKDVLVHLLIKKKPSHPGRLKRRIRLEPDGTVLIEDVIEGLARAPVPLDRALSYHMGSTRYADSTDVLGAGLPCPKPVADADGYFSRRLTIPPDQSGLRALKFKTPPLPASQAMVSNGSAARMSQE